MKANNIVTIIIVLIIGGLVGWLITQPGMISGTTSTAKPANAISIKELDLRMSMRKLWEDHITWTRMYMVSAFADSEDKNNVAQRLLKNQEDLGNAIKPYYGNDAGNRLTQLLKEHILTAADLIDAAKNNDENALNQANTKWYDNANQIADFLILSQANPNNWPNDMMRSALRQHLDLTKQEALDILNKRFDADIADYDRIHDQILMMADILSEGIIKQFPDKF